MIDSKAMAMSVVNTVSESKQIDVIHKPYDIISYYIWAFVFIFTLELARYWWKLMSCLVMVNNIWILNDLEEISIGEREIW